MPVKYCKIAALIIIAAMLLTGCVREPAEQNDLDRAGRGLKRTRVGIVLSPPGRGDMAVNDAALAGLKKAEDQLDIDLRVLNPGELANDRESLNYLAENNFDLVIAVGPRMQKVLTEVAPEFPDIKFAMVDGAAAGPNVLNMSFASEDSAFIAGAAAASLTYTGYVGFIGGNQMDVEDNYETSFTRGVQYINMTEGKQVKVLVAYAGVTPEAVKNPERGKSLALQQYDAGADIIFHTAGQTGMGVFQAAEQKKKWVIGSDNRNGVVPYNTYGSTVKKIDMALFNVVKNLVEGKFQAGVRTFGLKEGGVTFAPAQSVPPEVTGKLTALAGLVSSGKVDISKINIPEGTKIFNLNVPVDYGRQGTPGWNAGSQGSYSGTPGGSAAQSGSQGGGNWSNQGGVSQGNSQTGGAGQ